MPSEQAWKVQIWNYGKRQTEIMVVIADSFEGALEIAKDYVKPMQMSLMGVDLIGEVI